VTERMVYRMFFLGQNFVSGLICTLKAKNLKKSLETEFVFQKKTFFQP